MFLANASLTCSGDKMWVGPQFREGIFDKSAKSVTLLRNSSLQQRGIYEKIQWKNTQAVVEKGREYCQKIIESESLKFHRRSLKKERILLNNEIIEKIKAEEFSDLSGKISKLNEEFFKKVQKLEKEALFKLNLEKIELLSNIQKSKTETLNSIHSKSTKLISSLFPSTQTNLNPNSNRRNSFSSSKSSLRKSFEALSESSEKVLKIKSRLSKNI